MGVNITTAHPSTIPRTFWLAGLRLTAPPAMTSVLLSAGSGVSVVQQINPPTHKHQSFPKKPSWPVARQCEPATQGSQARSSLPLTPRLTSKRRALFKKH
jgi:hypothetical protein